MTLKTRELIQLETTGSAGVHALFAKAHSMDWDLERDVDWGAELRPDDPLVDFTWAPYGRTPTFATLPRHVRVSCTRQALGRQLNVLQVGESVAQDVCAKLALLFREEDYRNHAVAQAMDEARHHLAYRRILERMAEPVEDLDPFTEALFDDLLVCDDVTTLVATEQFFLESLAMRIFERLAEAARHPLLRDVVSLIKRDESRHMGFGVLFVARHLESLDLEGRVAFARAWLPRIVRMLSDGPGPIMKARATERLRRAGASDPEALAEQMHAEERELEAADRAQLLGGRRVPHLLASCRRAGLLVPELLEATALSGHPLIEGALRAPLVVS
jgi:hypothetical protein